MTSTSPRVEVVSISGPSTTALAGIGLLVLGSLVFAHWPALVGMVTLWNVSPMYSYGFAVPVISAFLLWTKRHELAALSPNPSRLAGAAALGMWLVLAVVGRAGGLQVVEQIAFLVGIVAAVLLLFGRRYVQLAWVPLAYLLLMIPIWDGLTDRLHFPFQLRSAELGLGLLRLAGIPAYREGTFISLPGITLEVARACSGVNYLIAVLALGIPLSYVYLRSMWRRIVLLAAAVIVAALSNGVRVALIGALAHHDFTSALHGPFHMLHGLFVSVIGYVALFAGLKLLAPAGAARDQRRNPATAPVSAPASVSAVAVVTLSALFVAFGANVFAAWTREASAAARLALPVELGDWSADTVSPAPVRDIERWPNADQRLGRRYRRPDGASIDVFVTYFAHQTQGKELVNFRTEELHRSALVERVGEAEAGAFNANRVTRQDRPALFWYYMGAGDAESGRYWVKARTLWNNVRGLSTGGAVVMLVEAPAGDQTTADGALLDLAWRVHREISPALARGAALPSVKE